MGDEGGECVTYCIAQAATENAHISVAHLNKHNFLKNI
jgi:hypothetical protein